MEDQGAGVAEARLSPRLAEAILSFEFFEVKSNFARQRCCRRRCRRNAGGAPFSCSLDALMNEVCSLLSSPPFFPCFVRPTHLSAPVPPSPVNSETCAKKRAMPVDLETGEASQAIRARQRWRGAEVNSVGRRSIQDDNDVVKKKSQCAASSWMANARRMNAWSVEVRVPAFSALHRLAQARDDLDRYFLSLEDIAPPILFLSDKEERRFFSLFLFPLFLNALPPHRTRNTHPRTHATSDRARSMVQPSLALALLRGPPLLVRAAAPPRAEAVAAAAAQLSGLRSHGGGPPRRVFQREGSRQQGAGGCGLVVGVPVAGFPRRRGAALAFPSAVGVCDGVA